MDTLQCASRRRLTILLVVALGVLQATSCSSTSDKASAPDLAAAPPWEGFELPANTRALATYPFVLADDGPFGTRTLIYVESEPVQAVQQLLSNATQAGYLVPAVPGLDNCTVSYDEGTEILYLPATDPAVGSLTSPRRLECLFEGGSADETLRIALSYSLAADSAYSSHILIELTEGEFPSASGVESIAIDPSTLDQVPDLQGMPLPDVADDVIDHPDVHMDLLRELRLPEGARLAGPILSSTDCSPGFVAVVDASGTNTDLASWLADRLEALGVSPRTSSGTGRWDGIKITGLASSEFGSVEVVSLGAGDGAKMTIVTLCGS